MSIAFLESSASPVEILTTERLVFGWWNTSLSPIGKSRDDDEQKQTARQIVKTLINDIGVDCLALGEVTLADLDYLKAGCDTSTLSIYDGTLKEGRLQFDTGAIYNRSRLAVNGQKSLVISHGRRNFKVANQIAFATPTTSPLNVFISHWPSRGSTEENIVARKSLATYLRRHVTEIENQSPNASIILLGDFNDEPFDESLAGHLLATRDRRLASTSKGFLYNPFWRLLGESEPHTLAKPGKGAGGSYFHSRGMDTRWRTFDQILFSAAFWGDGEWHLNERDTLILNPQSLVDLVEDDKVIFDHLPVLSVIERKIKQK